jgi:PAS domain S-box-containing protein
VWLVAIAFTIGLVYNGLSLTRRQIVTRLEQLQRVVSTFTVNDRSFDGALAAIAGDDELGTLARSFQTLTDQLRDSFAALAQNNQKMKILNDALSQSEQKLMQFLEAIPVGVFVMDATGKPYYANQRAQHILGKGIVSQADIKNLTEVYQAYTAGTNQPYPTQEQPIYRALQGQASTVDNLEVLKGEQRIPLEIWGTPIFDGEDNIRYAIAVFQDISDRKQADLERQRFTTQLEQLNIAYERFVPEEFLQLLAKRSIVDVQVGDAVEREMSVLFADICHFTSLAEQMPSDETFKLINAFLSRMEPPITRHKGFIDKYIGDEIMALFEKDCADDAVRAAIAMLRQLTRYNLTRQRRDRTPIEIGIGINTRAVMLGTVGGRHRMDSTVIGDTVNLASRLERLTRTYGVSLLISHHTFFQLDHNHPYHIRLIDRVQVKGKSESVSVFEVFDADPTPLRTGKLQTRTRFEQALMLYYCDDWHHAAQRFEACIRDNPGDSVAPIYLQRCRDRLAVS